MFSAALPAIAGIASGALGFFGQKSANEANAASAKQQMDFQERMRNTSWQAAVADMKAAGINPMFAVQQGGAPVPGGAMSVSQNTYSGADKGINSALAVAQTQAQLENIKADTRYKDSLAAQTAAQTPGTSASSAFTANKYGLANDVISILKTGLGYNKNVNAIRSSAKSWTPSSFVSGVKSDLSGLGSEMSHYYNSAKAAYNSYRH